MKIKNPKPSYIELLIDQKDNTKLENYLSPFKATQLSYLLGTLEKNSLFIFLEALLKINKLEDTLEDAPDFQLKHILKNLPKDLIYKIIQDSCLDFCSYIISLMEKPLQENVLEHIKEPKKSKVKKYLSYPKHSVGQIMETEFFTLFYKTTCNEALEIVKSFSQKESIYYIYCVDENQCLKGVVSLRKLIISSGQTPISDIMKSEVITLSTTDKQTHAAQLISDYDFIALPVVLNSNNLLCGIVLVEDILDLIQEQAQLQVYAQAGLTQEDRIFSPTALSVKKRLPWMLLNLLLASLASGVISLFEKTMSELIILASFKNIVASMGGNTGIQTLTVATRGMAIGEFSYIKTYKALLKEISVGLVIGFITGIFAGFLTYLWKGNELVSIIIFVSMVINSFIASCAGFLIPLILRKIKFDPASGSGVIVTMITDIFGFLSFLGIASYMLKLFNMYP